MDTLEIFPDHNNGLDHIPPAFLETIEAESLELIERPPQMLFPPRSQEFRTIATIITTRLQYALDQIKDAPRRMIVENQTPWCHPSLYRDSMPRSMQDAYASCALYLAKNQLNSPIILRSIEAKVDDLLTSPEPTTAFETLARTQALLLYHIIRVFDGDIRARASAEKTTAVLEAAGYALLAHITFEQPREVCPATPLPLYPLAATKEFWASWVFMESARRTFLITFFFLQLYRLLAGVTTLQCDGKLQLCHSLTMSAYLWRASDAFDFAIAWLEKKHFVVIDANFSGVIDEARADDLEEFGKILVTALMGIEETKAWFASRGGSL